MATHKATADRMLDERGYSGPIIRGGNPANLLERSVIDRIVKSYYFAESAFGLNAATLLDRAVDLQYVGGTYNEGQRPTAFICLILKLLQLVPEREVVQCYLDEGGEDFKYLRCLAAFYVRLTEEKSEDVYRRLEPLLSDKRKIKMRGNQGFWLSHVDEFVDRLLTEQRVCSTSLWKLVPRGQLEEEDKLEERVSPCQYLLDEEEEGSRRSSDRSRGGSVGSRSSEEVEEVRNGHRSGDDSD